MDTETQHKEVTQYDLKKQGHPLGFSKMFAPFMASMMKKANQKDLELLKSILEKSC